MRETGLEPVRRKHTPLKRARLPIPPLSHIFCSLGTLPIIADKTGIVKPFFKIFYKYFFILFRHIYCVEIKPSDKVIPSAISLKTGAQLTAPSPPFSLRTTTAYLGLSEGKNPANHAL